MYNGPVKETWPQPWSWPCFHSIGNIDIQPNVSATPLTVAKYVTNQSLNFWAFERTTDKLWVFSPPFRSNPWNANQLLRASFCLGTVLTQALMQKHDDGVHVEGVAYHLPPYKFFLGCRGLWTKATGDIPAVKTHHSFFFYKAWKAKITFWSRDHVVLLIVVNLNEVWVILPSFKGCCWGSLHPCRLVGRSLSSLWPCESWQMPRCFGSPRAPRF